MNLIERIEDYGHRSYWRWKYRQLQQWSRQLRGTIFQNGIPAYWWNERSNFGDLLTPALLYSYDYTPIHSTNFVPSESSHNLPIVKFVGVGSILHQVHPNYSGIILGTGFIREEQQMIFPNAKILAVRGELTKERIQCRENIVLGDPGLLAYRFFKTKPAKKHLMGIVPNHMEMLDLKNLLKQKKYDSRLKFINPMRSLNTVLRDIVRCEYIVSSSLHGLIIADALGIPNAWLKLTDKVIGGAFKFNDYYSALGVTKQSHCFSGDEKLETLLESASVPPPTVSKRQEELHHLFAKLKEFF